MPPLHLLVKPASSLCNMRCRYCFYADVAGRRSVPCHGVMSRDTAETLVRQAFAFAHGRCAFAFQGGEPTLAGLAFFEAFVALVKQHNTRRLPVRFSIQTNGLLLDDAWARFFARNGFLVGLSMDADAALHNAMRPDAQGKGTHARVSRAAALLKRSRCDTNILCVVTRDAARHAARVYQTLRPHGFLQFIPCIDDFSGSPGDFALTPALYAGFLSTTFDLYAHDLANGRYVSVRMFDNWLRMLAGHAPDSCSMSGRCACTPVVEGDGSVYPCDFYVLDAWRLGAIQDAPLADMLTGRAAQAFVAASLPQDPGCGGCRWAALCRGGCRRDREMPGGGLGPNRHCEAYRAFFARNIDRLLWLSRHVVARG